MNHLKIIRQFLLENRALEEVPETGHPFVTISREAGAGGHLLAYVLSSDFLQHQDSDLFRGWHVFDRTLCEVVAEDPELENALESLIRERYRSEFADFMEGLFTGRSTQYRIHRMTCRVVRMLAAIGKVIIVGRAGACVARGMTRGVNIRLIAPLPQRTVWMMKKLKIAKAEAERLIRQQDGERRRMVRTYYQCAIDDPLLYDAVFNSGTVPMHDISHSVIQMIRSRAGAMALIGPRGARPAPSAPGG